MPVGLHPCTLEELVQRFGWNTQRQALLRQLRDYVGVLRSAWGAVPIIVDGSFVSRKEHPNDIDVIVLVNELQLAGAPRPDQQTSVRRSWVNRRYGEEIDLKVANEDIDVVEWSEDFARVKDAPGLLKGLLKVSL